MAIQEYLSCDQNLTNGTVSPEFYDLANTYNVVAGSVIFVGILPFVLLNLSVFPIGSMFAVTFGALLMVAFQVVTQDEAYHMIGHQNSLAAIFLIIGVHIIAQYFEREQLLVKILRNILPPSLQFDDYLVRICIIAFLMSVFFTNDVCCIVLTPMLLKLWESQERSRNELETIVLAVMTTANIGAMVTVLSSLPMALLASHTNSAAFENSRLDMRVCFMYLLPVSAILGIVNTCFLVLHHRVRTRCIEKTKLVSEPSHSEQEMAGLTARDNNGHVNPLNISSHGFINGYMKAPGRDDITSFDGVYLGPAANQRSDDRISIPCQLETIPEDDILEISSSQSTSLRDCYDVETPSPHHNDYVGRGEAAGHGDYVVRGEAVALECSDSSSGDSDDDNDRMRNTNENLHQLNIHYRPGALQSQNLTLVGDSCTSLVQSLEQHGLRMSKRLGIYRSLQAFSVAHFMPLNGSSEEVAGLALLPSDSVAFIVTLCVLLLAVPGLLLGSCYTVRFDLGLVPVAAAIFAVFADAVLNRRSAQILVKRADWSIILLLFALFVWVQGFNNTHIIHFMWEKFGLRRDSYGAMGPRTIASVCMFVLVGSNLMGTVPAVLMICDLLEPCAFQRGLVLYVAVLSTAGSNLSLYGSVANMMTVQRSIQVLKYRPSFMKHFQYGFLTSLVLLPLGIMLTYGLLLIEI